MNDDDRDLRPSPDALLVQAQRENRGRLKIFLGAAPGVGKTYAMLEAARAAMRDGIDVVAGVVETHGRKETERLLNGVPVLPAQTMDYRGRSFHEMDLDALLTRRPQLALVDELAHTNVPGARHMKRWQDVDELLASGIDVYATLNVQHLESLNDIIEQITGVRVRETLPDQVLAKADEIELIDLPPHELIKRLRDGKVYVAEQAGLATHNFFTPGNLTALRELALRRAAERVDAQMVDYMRAHAIAGPWPTQERLVVYLGPGDDADRLVRAGKRIAELRDADWIAVTVETANGEDPEERDAIIQALRLASQLGGESTTLHGEDVIEEVLTFAREHNATQIVVGRNPRKSWLGGRSLAARFVSAGDDFNIVVIGGSTKPQKSSQLLRQTRATTTDLQGHAIGLAATAIATGISQALYPWVPSAALSSVYLVAILLVASKIGARPAVAASLLSFLAYDFCFTQPRWSLVINNPGEILQLMTFLAAALIVSSMAGRLRHGMMMSRENARRTSNLYDFERKVTAAVTKDDVQWAVVHHVAVTINGKSLIMAPDGGGMRVTAGYPPEDQVDDKSLAAAEWAWKHNKPAGRGSTTLPSALWLFIPMKTAHRAVGVLGVQMAEDADIPSPQQMQLLETLADQTAIAIERAQLVADIEDAKVLTERERLRSALLSSLSHDLRTPLVSIMGSASSLVMYDDILDSTTRRDLAQTIQDEAERLNRFVQNLLDMTRLGAGTLKPRLDWADLGDIVGSAIQRSHRLSRDHVIKVELDPDIPLIQVDQVLLEQVFFNLLDNACKYSPKGTTIKVWGRMTPDHLSIEVSDQGPGIPPQDREKVFDMFYRVDLGDTQVAGTGLGLAICRGIVEAHGGTIKTEPGLHGVGTSIIIHLPHSSQPVPRSTGDEL